MIDYEIARKNLEALTQRYAEDEGKLYVYGGLLDGELARSRP